jgi:hypothetical protein
LPKPEERNMTKPLNNHPIIQSSNHPFGLSFWIRFFSDFRICSEFC